MLCLLKIIENVQQNSVGAPYGRANHGSKKYVTEVENIEGYAGMIQSSLYPEYYYYIYPNMDLGKMVLGGNQYTL